MWLPNIDEGGSQGTIAADARLSNELKIEKNPGLSGKGNESYASILKKGKGGNTGGKPPRAQLCSDEAVASRTRSRKKERE